MNGAKRKSEDIMEQIASISNVTKKYQGVSVLKNISFTLNKGDTLGYLGPNGSGKTTTLKTMLGLLRYEEGSITIMGNDVKKEYNKLYGKIGVLFDENGLYERLTAAENMEFFLSAYGKRDLLPQAKELLGELDLGDAGKKKVGKFSKGMKRKLALARAMAIRPQLLLLDEPFDGIDIENRSRVIRILREYQTAHSITMMLTTHVMADIEELASRLVVLKKGSLIVDESMEQFSMRNGATLTDKYLEVVKDE